MTLGARLLGRGAGLVLAVCLATVTLHGQDPAGGAAQTPAETPASAPVPAQTPAAPASPTPAQPQPAAVIAPPVLPAGVTPPADYVIGPDDSLSIVFWRDKDMSSDVTVRPDGRITLPLLNDLQAAGRTPEQLRAAIIEAAGKFVEEPTVSVVVKQINSRKVFITGMITKPGAYPINSPTTVLQLISMAGGLHEFAKTKEIVISRTEDGQQKVIKFNYRDVLKGKNLKQNIELRPGDTVLIP